MKRRLSTFLLVSLFLITGCRIKESQATEDLPESGEPTASQRLQPADFEYMGAFRLPDSHSADVVQSWQWGGYALTSQPLGDPSGAADGYGGSLFATGHAWAHQVSEITIPEPTISFSKSTGDLNTAATIQPFADIFQVSSWEMPRVGLAYMKSQGSQTSDKLHLCWGGHLVEGVHLTHAWCGTNLTNPGRQGDWSLDVPHAEYSTNDYLFRIPLNWAAVHTGGKALASGRFRDGGWSGQGPSLFAIGPWLDGNPPANGHTLSCVTLLQYTSSADGGSPSYTMTGYHHSDEWSGAAWITAGDKHAVVFVGTKGVGECWYGDANGPCLDCAGERGWWSTTFAGRFIFYDPADLADVAAGMKEPWQPQPYASMNIDDRLYHIRSPQQWYHVGAAAYDEVHQLFYVLEPLADDDKPLVHVWKIH